MTREWYPALAYGTSDKLALNRARGHWVVYDIRTFQPGNKLANMPVVGTATNRRQAAKLVKA